MAGRAEGGSMTFYLHLYITGLFVAAFAGTVRAAWRAARVVDACLDDDLGIMAACALFWFTLPPIAMCVALWHALVWAFKPRPSRPRKRRPCGVCGGNDPACRCTGAPPMSREAYR
jgi:hypothetical protein